MGAMGLVGVKEIAGLRDWCQWDWWLPKGPNCLACGGAPSPSGCGTFIMGVDIVHIVLW